MAKRFEGKVAIVTGASSGMGLGVAIQLAQEGAKVVMTARTESKLEAAAADIKAKGGDVTTIAADVSLDASNAAIVEKALLTYGRLDIAFLNAGTYGGAPFDQMTDELFDSIINTNVRSVVMGLKHVLPAIKKSGGNGSIIVNSSTMGSAASALPFFAGGGLYSASKSAADTLVKWAAIEAAEHGTRVNAIAPGIVKTNILPEGMSADVPDIMAKDAHLNKRAGEVSDVTPFVCFLASDEASFVTGSIHLCDGGASVKM